MRWGIHVNFTVPVKDGSNVEALMQSSFRPISGMEALVEGFQPKGVMPGRVCGR